MQFHIQPKVKCTIFVLVTNQNVLLLLNIMHAKNFQDDCQTGNSLLYEKHNK